ncbi:hypothetical protein PT2222_30300 [Paraburkholderia tropica]
MRPKVVADGHNAAMSIRASHVEQTRASTGTISAIHAVKTRGVRGSRARRAPASGPTPAAPPHSASSTL